ncbi:MAG: hypothetical protein D6731_15305 [Planctomycetota bacterium]|nr:MAG: hypothetical protein D6731_15305 [Planctomycetota bacterium]
MSRPDRPTDSARRACAAILCSLLAASAPVWGQDPPPDDADARRQVAETRLYEALRAGAWREAIRAYQALERPSPRHDFLAAQAHYNLGELEQSAALLGDLLERRPAHLAALYALARVRARQLRWEEARTLLRDCARLGQSVLRDLQAGDDRELFAPLLRDSNFLVGILRAGASWGPQASPQARRDPFRPPAEPGPESGQDPPAERTRRDEALAAQVKEVEELLADLRALLGGPDPDLDLLLSKLDALRGALRRLETQDHPDAARAVARLRREAEELDARVNPLRLRLYVADGNLHLRAMARLLVQERYGEVAERWERLEALIEQMRAERSPAFRANAEAFQRRGRKLAERARALLEIEALDLRVSGIVLPPAPAPRRAVINDRIYEEGQDLTDPSQGGPLAGVRVVRIQAGAVVFSRGGLEFVRPLRDPR